MFHIDVHYGNQMILYDEQVDSTFLIQYELLMVTNLVKIVRLSKYNTACLSYLYANSINEKYYFN